MSEKPPAKPRKNNRHPILKDWPRGVWCPAAAGVVTRYPHTEEGYRKMQEVGRRNAAAIRASGRTFSRKGVPNGWGHKKLALIAVRAEAKAEAAIIINHMLKEGLLDIPTSTDAELANEALEVVVAITRDVTVTDPKIKMAAAKIVLEYTKAKPVTKIENTIRTAESFLDDLAAECLPPSAE